MRLPSVFTVLTAALLVTACDKPEPTTSPTDATASNTPAPDEAGGTEEATEAADAEAGPAEDETQAQKDSFLVATFNVAYAHDPTGDGPKLSQDNRAKTDEDWAWKVQQIAKVIVAAKPDVVALHELGGDGEASDVVAAIQKLEGPEYKWAYQASDDPTNGHNSAILSRFPIENERRLDIHLRRQVVADVTLPSGDKVTVVAIHAPEGSRDRPLKARRKQIDALKREVNKMSAEQPVIVMGTLGSNIGPHDDDYKNSAPGMLAGVHSGNEDDDCQDAIDVGTLDETTTHDEIADRIFTCGLEMRDADTAGGELIMRNAVDEWDKPWSEIPIDKEPHRDVSDHLMLTAEVAFPKKAEAAEAAEGGDEATAEDGAEASAE